MSEISLNLIEDREIIYDNLERVRDEFSDGFSGEISSRYLIFDSEIFFVIVSDEAQPLTKFFMKKELEPVMRTPLLGDYCCGQ